MGHCFQGRSHEHPRDCINWGSLKLAVEAARASNMALISFAKLDKAVVIGPVEGRFQRNHYRDGRPRRTGAF